MTSHYEPTYIEQRQGLMSKYEQGLLELMTFRIDVTEGKPQAR